MTTHSSIIAWRASCEDVQLLSHVQLFVTQWNAACKSSLSSTSSWSFLISEVLGCNLKNNRLISVRFQGKPFSITVIQVYVPTTDAEVAEVGQFFEDLQDLLELPPKKRCHFHHRGLECENRMSKDTWSNRQVCPLSTKYS